MIAPEDDVLSWLTEAVCGDSHGPPDSGRPKAWYGVKSVCCRHRLRIHPRLLPSLP